MTEPAAVSTGLGALWSRAWQPVDIASLAAFRILFGLLGCFGAVRFLLNGWVERFYIKPTFTFKYWGFEWVELLSPTLMYAAFVAMAVLALAIAVGLFYRVAIILFFIVFTYVELIDVTNYLNHYWLVSLLALLMCVLPLHRAWSVDAWRNPTLRASTLPAWMLWLLRFQVGLVYVYAALAKTGSDWLLHAQPLNIWLTALVDTPIIGGWLGVWAVALAMSWGGFLYDATIWAFLLVPRTRAIAYVTVVVFHTMTALFFTIGMFPLIMITVTPIFFEPDWPKRFVPKRWHPNLDDLYADVPRNLRRPIALAVGVYMVVQTLLPARWIAYPGNVLWHEQGMRWAWKVMVREKNGSLIYRVRSSERPNERLVPPSRYLTRHQEREMSGQPDLILQLAHHIGADLKKQGQTGVEVRADALASLNGRAPARLIDPNIDLMTVSDGVWRADWILIPPSTPPIRLSRPR